MNQGRTTGNYRGIDYWYERDERGAWTFGRSDTDTIAGCGGTEEELIRWIKVLICWSLDIPVGVCPYHILPEEPAYERLKASCCKC